MCVCVAESRAEVSQHTIKMNFINKVNKLGQIVTCVCVCVCVCTQSKGRKANLHDIAENERESVEMGGRKEMGESMVRWLYMSWPLYTIPTCLNKAKGWNKTHMTDYYNRVSKGSTILCMRTHNMLQCMCAIHKEHRSRTMSLTGRNTHTRMHAHTNTQSYN